MLSAPTPNSYSSFYQSFLGSSIYSTPWRQDTAPYMSTCSELTAPRIRKDKSGLIRASHSQHSPVVPAVSFCMVTIPTAEQYLDHAYLPRVQVSQASSRRLRAFTLLPPL
ncbi:hypothetical protein BC834DRAFT_867178 [Gloeopeniophorella convolvens]|nr:hypothetical protein BC834DRAFT_867178 [Gloeopeniophorella convolvens]